MDKRRNYYIGLDAETCNAIVNGKELDLSQSLVYDIGWAVTDKKGNIYKTRSYIIREIFIGEPDLMQTAYYADKIPQYWEDVRKGSRKIVSFWEMWRTLKADMKECNAKAVFAHNARFDYTALTNTIRYLSGSKFRFFFPYGTEIWDTLKMAKVIANQKAYPRFCERNGYMTAHKKPRPRMTAEVLYRYITQNTGFKESHTGLEDVLIETQIFAKALAQHKKMEKRLFKD